jgi:hypothetical protein
VGRIGESSATASNEDNERKRKQCIGSYTTDRMDLYRKSC